MENLPRLPAAPSHTSSGGEGSDSGSPSHFRREMEEVRYYDNYLNIQREDISERKRQRLRRASALFQLHRREEIFGPREPLVAPPADPLPLVSSGEEVSPPSPLSPETDGVRKPSFINSSRERQDSMQDDFLSRLSSLLSDHDKELIAQLSPKRNLEVAMNFILQGMIATMAELDVQKIPHSKITSWRSEIRRVRRLNRRKSQQLRDLRAANDYNCAERIQMERILTERHEEEPRNVEFLNYERYRNANKLIELNDQLEQLREDNAELSSRLRQFEGGDIAVKETFLKDMETAFKLEFPSSDWSRLRSRFELVQRNDPPSPDKPLAILDFSNEEESTASSPTDGAGPSVPSEPFKDTSPFEILYDW